MNLLIKTYPCNGMFCSENQFYVFVLVSENVGYFNTFQLNESRFISGELRCPKRGFIYRAFIIGNIINRTEVKENAELIILLFYCQHYHEK